MRVWGWVFGSLWDGVEGGRLFDTICVVCKVRNAGVCGVFFYDCLCGDEMVYGGVEGRIR